MSHVFYAFAGNGPVTEKRTGSVQVWDLKGLLFDDFVSEIRHAANLADHVKLDSCFSTRQQTSDLYSQCLWGLLLPLDNNGINAAHEHLINLFAHDFLYPVFHVAQYGVGAWHRPPIKTRLHLNASQNQSASFASSDFETFLAKMNTAAPLLSYDVSQTCEWTYDDCSMHLSNNLFQELTAYDSSKRPQQADREYGDITMVIELLLISRGERDPGPTLGLTKKLIDRSAMFLPLQEVQVVERAIELCADRRGAYVHGRYVKEVLDVLKEECLQARGEETFNSAPCLKLVDFNFAKLCTMIARFILVECLYVHTHYRKWSDELGGVAGAVQRACGDELIKAQLHSKGKEILELLPDWPFKSSAFSSIVQKCQFLKTPSLSKSPDTLVFPAR